MNAKEAIQKLREKLSGYGFSYMNVNGHARGWDRIGFAGRGDPKALPHGEEDDMGVKFDTKGTILAEKLGNEVANRGMLMFTRVDRNEVSITLPESRLMFCAWVDPDAVTIEGVVFSVKSASSEFSFEDSKTELHMSMFGASVEIGIEVFKTILETMLERRMADFSELSLMGSKSGLDEESQIRLGLIDPRPIAEINEALMRITEG